MAGVESCIRKLSRIWLPFGVNIRNMETMRRKTGEPRGISIRNEFAAKWVLVPFKGKAIFKSYDSALLNTPTSKSVKKIRMYNELLCATLCDQLSIPHAEYECAHNGLDKGLLSYNVLGEEEYIVPMISNPGFIGDFIDRLKSRENVNSDEIRGILKTLYSYMLFDIRTMQTDRNLNNVPIVKHRITGKVRTGELMDNEFAYMSYNMLRNTIGGDDFFGLFSYGKMDMDSLVYTYDMKMNRSKSSYCLDVYKFQDERTLEERIKEVCILAKMSPDFNEILSDFMDDFDLDSAIKVLRKRGIVANKDYIEYIKSIDKYIYDRFQYHIEHSQEYVKKYLESKPEDYKYSCDRNEIMHMLNMARCGSSSVSDSVVENYEIFKQYNKNHY